MLRLYDALMTGAAVGLVLLLTMGIARAEIITSVTDGDTVRIGDERIRLRGIDTPEISRPRCKAERAKGLEAKAALIELVEGKDVEVQRLGRDVYGRTLAVIRIDGKWDVGSILMARGLAMPWLPGKSERERRAAAWCGAGR